MNPRQSCPNVRIDVSDVGPIKRGSVDLRPLTVFVGPSNSGKTYFATLIYALHRVFGGFPRAPFLSAVHRFKMLEWLARLSEQPETKAKAAPGGIANSAEQQRALTIIAEKLNTDTGVSTALQHELARCFGLRNLANLLRSGRGVRSARVSLGTALQDAPLWSFELMFSKSGVSQTGRIEARALDEERAAATERSTSRPSAPERDSRHDLSELAKFLAEQSRSIAFPWSSNQSRIHYLPAARSGIMQSHRVVASALLSHLPRAGLEHLPDVPLLSGVASDFMQELVLYTESDRHGGHVQHIADALEKEVLLGHIDIGRRSSEKYPEVRYYPHDSSTDVSLSRVSSMVSELAPLVLLLRGNLRRGNTLILEEPEAHLHPAVQASMAKVLGSIVNEGVNVILTTHSDWLLQELANLIREGELKNEHAKSSGYSGSLLPEDVGVWLFRGDSDSEGSSVQEIVYDRAEGIVPEDYDAVAEQLYNRSARLQNIFENRSVSPRDE